MVPGRYNPVFIPYCVVTIVTILVGGGIGGKTEATEEHDPKKRIKCFPWNRMTLALFHVRRKCNSAICLNRQPEQSSGFPAFGNSKLAVPVLWLYQAEKF
jgi:hypothetical protein